MITEETEHGETIITEGKATFRLQNFFDAITFILNDRKIYTLATVPDATKNEGQTIYVSDATAGGVTVYSDGVNWRIDQTTLLT